MFHFGFLQSSSVMSYICIGNIKRDYEITLPD